MLTKKEIGVWYDEGVEMGATHMIIVCDTLSYEDYAYHVMPNEDVLEKIKFFKRSPMQRVMECYDLSMDRNEQLSVERVFNYSKAKVHDTGSRSDSSTN